MSETELILQNGTAARVADLPIGDWSRLRLFILEKIAGGSRLAALFPFKREAATCLLAVVANPDSPDISLAAGTVGETFSSITPECPEAHMFEREIAEQGTSKPVGHPWLKPVRFLHGAPGVMEFYRVEGEQVHEVAVGPVHAGVIEPGHFRFQCQGEIVMHLEIALGFQHRGIERSLRGGPTVRTRHLMETAAGDTTIGHAFAYALAMEALSGEAVSAEASRVRGVALELERIANHTGDLGALSGDVGFLPTANYCGRLRGDILNLTALVAGNRFGRGLIAPGGVLYGMDAAMRETIRVRLDAAYKDICGAVDLMFGKPSVLARFDETGKVSIDAAHELGLVGPAARASGLRFDTRLDQPFGPYRADSFSLSVGANGDVMDRARMRREEIAVSVALLREWLSEPLEPEVVDARVLPALAADSVAVAMTEGWRGRICHVALTNGEGKFDAYKIVDPSFFNWSGLAVALRGQQVSDFPLCNKSFNLSYSGHDL